MDFAQQSFGYVIPWAEEKMATGNLKDAWNIINVPQFGAGDKQALYIKGQIAFRTNNTHHLRGCEKKMREANPRDSRSHALTALLHCVRGEHEEAILQLRRSFVTTSTTPDLGNNASDGLLYLALTADTPKDSFRKTITAALTEAGVKTPVTLAKQLWIDHPNTDGGDYSRNGQPAARRITRDPSTWQTIDKSLAAASTVRLTLPAEALPAAAGMDTHPTAALNTASAMAHVTDDFAAGAARSLSTYRAHRGAPTTANPTVAVVIKKRRSFVKPE